MERTSHEAPAPPPAAGGRQGPDPVLERGFAPVPGDFVGGRIEHGRHRLARVLARLLRLPLPSAAATTRLTVTARAGGEQWQRTFDGRHLDSRQYESNGSELAERFGLLELRFRLAPSGGGLIYIQREAAILVGSVRVPIPGAWAPRVAAREDPAYPQRVRVDVRIALPGIGPLMAYTGVIDVEDTAR